MPVYSSILLLLLYMLVSLCVLDPIFFLKIFFSFHFYQFKITVSAPFKPLFFDNCEFLFMLGGMFMLYCEFFVFCLKAVIIFSHRISSNLSSPDTCIVLHYIYFEKSSKYLVCYRDGDQLFLPPKRLHCAVMTMRSLVFEPDPL